MSINFLEISKPSKIKIFLSWPYWTEPKTQTDIFFLIFNSIDLYFQLRKKSSYQKITRSYSNLK